MIEQGLLTEAELQEFLQWAKEKRDHYDRIVKRTEKYLSSATKPDSRIAQTVASDGQDRELILAVMRENGKWMSNQDIRAAIKASTGFDPGSDAVLWHLKAGENSLFRRTGKARYTVWKLIDGK